MRLIWSSRALRDLQAIEDYIAKSDPDTAIQFVNRLLNDGKSLLKNPFIGRLGRMKDTRELVAHRHYVLIYKVSAKSIRILTVIHTARRWPP